MNYCNICPRGCNVDRSEKGLGFCSVPFQIKASRAALHYWEEPCISGEAGSGAVFFSGCSLRCVFCQNKNIANGTVGKYISMDRLVDIFFELKAQGALNINLVTPTHYIPQIIEAIQMAKARNLDLPFVYNSSGYEKVESLRLLDGLIDVYLPDFKYMDPIRAKKYSHAEDYPKYAKKAIAEMYRQVGKPVFDENGILKRGIIVRHLQLPDGIEDSKKVVKYLYDTYGDNIYISIMNQYTPLYDIEKYPELNRKLTDEEYDELVDYAIDLGVENGFIQEGETASESFVPEFDGTGL